MATDDTMSEVKRRFDRRFAFGVNAILSTLLGILLLLHGLWHPFNSARINGEIVFAGFLNPYLLIGGAACLTLVALHTLWLLWREGRLTTQRFAFSVHSVLAAASFAMLVTLGNSAWMTETLKQAYRGNAPQLPPAPSPAIWLALPLIVITLLPHLVWWLYHELLERSLQQAALQAKPKRGSDHRLSLGDDGELLDLHGEQAFAPAHPNQKPLR